MDFEFVHELLPPPVTRSGVIEPLISSLAYPRGDGGHSCKLASIQQLGSFSGTRMSGVSYTTACRRQLTTTTGRKAALWREKSLATSLAAVRLQAPCPVHILCCCCIMILTCLRIASEQRFDLGAFFM